MEECEICSKECRELINCEIEGSSMYVCPNCANRGKVIEKEPESKPYVFEKQSEDKEDIFSENERELKGNFNLLIQKKRQQQGLTIKDLANKLNIKESIMKKIEHGEFTPDDSTISKLERFFKTKLIEPDTEPDNTG